MAGGCPWNNGGKHLNGCGCFSGSGSDQPKKKKHQPKHAKPQQCTYTWSTRPADPKNWVAGAHYDHVCASQNKGKGSSGNECGGTHQCRTWNCSETKSS